MPIKYANKQERRKKTMDNIIVAHAVKNACYKAARPMKPAGIVVHSTGANNPYLKRYVDCPAQVGENRYSNHWNVEKPGRQSVCVHAFIGYDKNKQVRVAEILPLEICCWGIGRGVKGSYNYAPPHIQFEICEDDLQSKTYYSQAFDVAAEYCAYLCEKYHLAVKTIVSHKEAYQKGYGSNHGDPEHWMKRFGDTMDAFRARVQAKLEKKQKSGETLPAKVSKMDGIHEGDLVSILPGATYYNGVSIPGWVQKQKWYVKAEPVNNRVVIDKNEDGTNSINSPVNAKYLTVVKAAMPGNKKVVSYLAKVAVLPVPVYEGPSVKTPKVGSINRSGVFTIVEESYGVGADKWGKLKSGLGWVPLGCFQKL